MKPRYIELYNSGELSERVIALKKLFSPCALCPRLCGVNRHEDEKGFCRTGKNALISSYVDHHGEEPPISGSHGSGTIFFSFCNLSCVFCQNYQISHEGDGMEFSTDALADAMLSLQKKGCHNVNLVSPTHVIYQIVEALEKAASRGFSLPLVYNSNGYDAVEVLKLLDGIIDIYLPDAKYAANDTACTLSGCENYVDVNRAALKEMYNQVGGLVCDRFGVAQRGMLIRHLVLPNELSGSHDLLRYVAQELSPNVNISIMAQYHPCYNAFQHKKIARPLHLNEYEQVLEWVETYGFRKAYIQELNSSYIYLPDFEKENPFQ